MGRAWLVMENGKFRVQREVKPTQKDPEIIGGSRDQTERETIASQKEGINWGEQGARSSESSILEPQKDPESIN